MSRIDSFTRLFPRSDLFPHRHLGPRDRDLPSMLRTLGIQSLDQLVEKSIPAALRFHGDLKTPPARGEAEVLQELADLAARNQVYRSFLGMGYHDCITPPVVLRNILENPGWYTAYTPYQAEISQGRMEALLNFQTMVIDLTGLPVANCSLLDEATAAAEAMTLCRRVLDKGATERNTFFVSDACHPQTIEVVRTRAEPLGIQVVVGNAASFEFTDAVFGGLVQYPDTFGEVIDHQAFVERAHATGALAVMAVDLLALTLLKTPGEMGADIVVGNSQRFGVPMGYGGPHAAFLSARDEYKRQMPGRIIGLSIDATGKPALRLALATREQHIRRDKATSNICTAQVLLAVVASMYAVYHGPDGLRAIADRVRRLTGVLALGMRSLGTEVLTELPFDTLRLRPSHPAAEVMAAAHGLRMNLRDHGDGTLGVALDETTTFADVEDLWHCFAGKEATFDCQELLRSVPELPSGLKRASPFLTHPTFHRYRSETEMLRYLHRLEAKDLSLTTSMIPLGSCTMKLNATTQMIPMTMPGFGRLHPFAPLEQTQGYRILHQRLSDWLCDITGFAGCSLQPNAGSQGEYTGLLTIRAFHRSQGQPERDVCLIPSSAHGTNPASASMCGMTVVVVACEKNGNIDLADLRAKAKQHEDRLAAAMVTYPSTFGVFEDTIKELCSIVHMHGGQVYLDGANMNAQVGLLRPGDLGADVCHLNLHKTFCIPHGGGGPGMGPICVASHLVPFLPGHPVVRIGGQRAIGAVSAAPFGSPSILVIPYAYIAMMGPDGLKKATQVAILSANYIAKRLEDHYPVLYRGQNDHVAHECILDLRPLKASAGIEAADVAKRLIDYGFHAPTMSFPVAGTLMIEPTESESKEEIDRFCEAMIAIRAEIREIEEGKADRENNLLKHAPHTAEAVTAEVFERPYSRERAAFPAPWTREHKFWPPVARVNDLHGDRNLICSCPPVDAYVGQS